MELAANLAEAFTPELAYKSLISFGMSNLLTVYFKRSFYNVTWREMMRFENDDHFKNTLMFLSILAIWERNEIYLDWSTDITLAM